MELGNKALPSELGGARERKDLFVAGQTKIAIIGAGPYGLSLAAHLNARGVPFRIFGHPMDFWINQMPTGMMLKSDGFASNIYDPEDRFTLAKFCAEYQIPYADLGIAVGLDTFIEYGLAFARALVPQLETKLITSISPKGNFFALQAEDGEIFTAQHVVVAIGIAPFAYIPAELAKLPASAISHSVVHRDLSRFRDRKVAVIGSGASATDLAMLLHEAGAHVQMIARKEFIRFNDKPPLKSFSRAVLTQLREPLSGIGPGWRNKIFGDAPWLVWYLPEALRREIYKRSHGPAGGWFAREKIESGEVPVRLGTAVERARMDQDQVELTVRDSTGATQHLRVDHVMAATGYKLDVNKIDFLSSEITSKLTLFDGAPVLASNFESSVPNLYFIGVIAAPSFGPVLRFAFGADFTSRRLSKALTRRAATA